MSKPIKINLWCLTCDRAGRRFHGTSLDDMIEHYKAEHADLDMDALPDHEIITAFPSRLRTKVAAS